MSENEILEPEFENEDVVNDNQNTIHSESKKKPYHTESFLYTFMVAFGVIFLFCQLMFQIILTPIKVVGISMQPTINISVLSDFDENHCDIVYYRQNKTYQNGDVVIISNKSQDYIKDNEVGFLIKRIIALPGQSITFFLTNVAEKDGETAYFYDFVVKDKDGNVVDVDDSFLQEEMYFTEYEYTSFLDYDTYKSIFFNLRNFANDEDKAKSIIFVEDGSYFVMGDNRNHSTDSRVFGTINHSHIDGEVKLQVPYGNSILKAIWIKIKSII